MILGDTNGTSVIASEVEWDQYKLPSNLQEFESSIISECNK
jgi:hypothetical protein